MLEQKLNTVATNYFEGKCTFDDLFRAFENYYRNRYKGQARKYGLEVEDVISHCYEVLWVTSTAYPRKVREKDFSHYLNRSITNKLGKVAEKNSKYNRLFVVKNEGNEGDDKRYMENIADSYNLEEDLIQKENDDKRQLIVQISKCIRLKPNTIQLLSTLIDEYDGCTVHSAAKRCGMCPKTAKRRIDKIVDTYFHAQTA